MKLWTEVSSSEFYTTIGAQDVHPSILPGKYPYTAIWQTPAREAKGKSVGFMEAGVAGTRYYLPSKH